MNCRPRCLCSLMVLISVLVAPTVLSAATLVVDLDGKTGYDTIAEAVDAAVDGDTIVINPGTYTGRGNRDIELHDKSITIQSSDPGDAEVVEATIIDCAGAANDPHRAFVISDSTAEIKGLTIVNGLAEAGGAILCQDGVLAIENCRLVNNGTLAGGPGGAVCCYDAAVNIAGCRVAENFTGAGASGKGGDSLSGGDGGGVYASNSVVYVSDSAIVGNVTGGGADSNTTPGDGGNGGGIYADGLVVIDSTITGNVCGDGGDGPDGGFGGIGGGIFSARASIDTSIIEGNAAGSAGVDATDSKGGDGEGAVGGGIYCSDSIQIFSSLVAGNRGGSGAGLWCSQGLIDHCTIAGNRGTEAEDLKDADALGAGVSCSAETIVTNSILWDNVPDQILGHDCDNVLYCDIQDSACQTSLGVLADDPRFVEPGYWDQGLWVSGDFHLAAGSPCIDAGDPAYTAGDDETDLDGRSRLGGSAVDIGAYEENSLVAVYRFWSSKTNKHFYTASETERDKLINEYATVWTYEGPAYYAYAQASVDGVVPVYRLRNATTGSHFWTTDESERTSLLESKTEQWVDEGIVFYVYAEADAASGIEPVYRFWSDAIGGHFYTISESEKDKLIDEYGNAWIFEGVVWYALAELENGDDGSRGEGSNVYEFINAADAVAFTLELTATIDGKPVGLDTTELTFTGAAGNMQMDVDLDALTTQLNALSVETEMLDVSATAGDRVSGQGQYEFGLAIVGAFDSAVARGPYAIDSRSLAFGADGQAGTVGDGEMFTITGSAIIDGEKSSINLTLDPTDFELDGSGTFAQSNSAGVLDVSMDGPFKWSRRGSEDLLFERTAKGATLRVYVTAVELQTTGAWSGKQAETEDTTTKKEK